MVSRYLSRIESRQPAPGTLNLRRLGLRARTGYEAADCGLLRVDLAAGIRRVKRQETGRAFREL